MEKFTWHWETLHCKMVQLLIGVLWRARICCAAWMWEWMELKSPPVLEIGCLVLGGSAVYSPWNIWQSTLKYPVQYAPNLYPKRSILVGVPLQPVSTIEGPQLGPYPIRTPWNVLTSVITGNGLVTGGLGFYPFKSSGCNRLKLSGQHMPQSLDTAPISY